MGALTAWVAFARSGENTPVAGGPSSCVGDGAVSGEAEEAASTFPMAGSTATVSSSGLGLEEGEGLEEFSSHPRHIGAAIAVRAATTSMVLNEFMTIGFSDIVDGRQEDRKEPKYPRWWSAAGLSDDSLAFDAQGVDVALGRSIPRTLFRTTQRTEHIATAARVAANPGES